MKQKYILIIILVLILAGVGYYLVRSSEPETIEVANNELRTFSHRELGLEFSYRVGSDGYVLEESMPARPSTTTTLLRTFTLFRTEDDKNRNKIPEGGEGPPVIVIQVLNNYNKLQPQMWAEENVFYSNINLKQGAVSQATIGGAPAIRYMADGLYASDNAVITDGENVYVVTGQFIDANSDLRRDFSPFLDSIRFIPKAQRVAENPEGEADPDVMRLDMKTWQWISAEYNDGRTIKPKDPGKFTLAFSNNGTFSVGTNCNSMGGNYQVTGKQISFSNIMSTLMFCEGSQETDFRKLLEQATSYFFTSKGELVLDLKFDSGSVTFR